MNAELRRITMAGLPEDFPSHLSEIARMSDPLLAGSYSGQLLCIAGLATATVLSDEAYVWAWDTAVAKRHRVIYALLARRSIVIALGRYPRIIGHCTRAKWRWLYSLGAEITDVNGDLFAFEIRA